MKSSLVLPKGLMALSAKGRRFAEALPPAADAAVEAVLGCARVRAAVAALAGPGAVRAPFKGCVRSLPGVIDQSWHKDQMGFEGDFGRRRQEE